jgi:hypothetical protein
LRSLADPVAFTFRAGVRETSLLGGFHDESASIQKTGFECMHEVTSLNNRLPPYTIPFASLVIVVCVMRHYDRLTIQLLVLTLNTSNLSSTVTNLLFTFLPLSSAPHFSLASLRILLLLLPMLLLLPLHMVLVCCDELSSAFLLRPIV